MALVCTHTSHAIAWHKLRRSFEQPPSQLVRWHLKSDIPMLQNLLPHSAMSLAWHLAITVKALDKKDNPPA